MKENKYLWGLLLIIIGIGGLLSNWLNIHIWSWSMIWPLFILVPGLGFEYAYFTSRKNPGLLVPGGILTTIGLLFFFETVTNWYFSAYTWPIYIFAVAVGLFQLYYFGGRQKAILGVSLGLGGFAGICLINAIFGSMLRWIRQSPYVFVVLIIIGIILIVTSKSKE